MNPEREVTVRRIGSTPVQRGSATNVSCPDCFEDAVGTADWYPPRPGVPTGDYAIIGTATTADQLTGWPADARIGSSDTVIIVDRRTLLDALAEVDPTGGEYHRLVETTDERHTFMRQRYPEAYDE